MKIYILFIKFFIRAPLKTRLIKEKADRCGSCKETFRRRAVALRGRLTQQLTCISAFSQKGFLEVPIIKVTEAFTVPVTFLLFLSLMTLHLRGEFSKYVCFFPINNIFLICSIKKPPISINLATKNKSLIYYITFNLFSMINDKLNVL